MKKGNEIVGKKALSASNEDRTHRAVKQGRLEITYVHLYERLMDFNKPLTPIERMLIAAMVKRTSISPVKINSIAFAADMYIDMAKKQDLKEFEKAGYG